MATPMRQAASANLKKDKKDKKSGSLLDPLVVAYQKFFPPVPPPAKQGTMPMGPRRRMMEQEEAQERSTYEKPKPKPKTKAPSGPTYWP